MFVSKKKHNELLNNYSNLITIAEKLRSDEYEKASHIALENLAKKHERLQFKHEQLINKIETTKKERMWYHKLLGSRKLAMKNMQRNFEELRQQHSALVKEHHRVLDILKKEV